MKSGPYAPAVGSLMYAMVTTRPDIFHTIAKNLHDNVGNIRSCRDHRVHKGADYRCIWYRLHILPLRTGCRAVSLTQPKVDGERGRSRLGRVHVEAFQDMSDVVGLTQEQLSFIAIPTNLHSKDVPGRTEVLHGKL